MCIKEILIKEEEKHRLIFIGIINNFEEVIRLTEKTFECHNTSFAETKMILVNFFYSVVLKYKDFIETEKFSNSNLKKHHFKKTGAYISTLSNGIKAELDKEMKTSKGISFAWHFSNMIYDDIFDNFCLNTPVFDKPQETDEFFYGESKKIYPLTINQVIRMLEADDSSFWNICALYMQELSHKVVNYFLQRSDNYGFSDIVKDETWENTYKVLRNRLIEKQGNMPVYKNGSDFRNYIIKVCKFQTNNLQKKYMQRNDYVEDFLQIKTDCENEENDAGFSVFLDRENNDSDLDSETYELNINIDNPYEVAYAVSIILLNSSHPFYRTLIEGIEDKVGILIDKAVNMMSYNDIISDLYVGQNISKEDTLRAVVKARKDFERVRKTLCERLKKLVNNHNRIYRNNIHSYKV